MMDGWMKPVDDHSTHLNSHHMWCILFFHSIFWTTLYIIYLFALEKKKLPNFVVHCKGVLFYSTWFSSIVLYSSLFYNSTKTCLAASPKQRRQCFHDNTKHEGRRWRENETITNQKTANVCISARQQSTYVTEAPTEASCVSCTSAFFLLFFVFSSTMGLSAEADDSNVAPLFYEEDSGALVLNSNSLNWSKKNPFKRPLSQLTGLVYNNRHKVNDQIVTYAHDVLNCFSFPGKGREAPSDRAWLHLCQCATASRTSLVMKYCMRL